MNTTYGFQLRRSTLVTALLTFLLGSILFLPSPPSAYACYTWSVGARVGLKRGGEIRTGPGTNQRVHTIVPQDNWPVDIINGPRSVGGQQWWDVSRKNIDGGGTGWVSFQQAEFGACGGAPSTPPNPQPQPTSTTGFEPRYGSGLEPSQPALCKHTEAQVALCELFSRDDDNVGNNFIGNDEATVVVVPRGWTIAVYEHDTFVGRCQQFGQGFYDLGKSAVGNDNVTSLRINSGCEPPVKETNKCTMTLGLGRGCLPMENGSTGRLYPINAYRANNPNIPRDRQGCAQDGKDPTDWIAEFDVSSFTWQQAAVVRRRVYTDIAWYNALKQEVAVLGESNGRLRICLSQLLGEEDVYKRTWIWLR